jgi:hypothetical protein
MFLLLVFKNTFFVQRNPGFWLQIDLSDIKNCYNFSVVPSIINENIKRALPLAKIRAKLFMTLDSRMTIVAY